MTLAPTPRPVRPDPSLWARLRAVARGLAALAGPALAALPALLSALCGTPPGWARRAGRRIADRYRLGYHNAVDAEVIEQEPHR